MTVSISSCATRPRSCSRLSMPFGRCSLRLTTNLLPGSAGILACQCWKVHAVSGGLLPKVGRQGCLRSQVLFVTLRCVWLLLLQKHRLRPRRLAIRFADFGAHIKFVAVESINRRVGRDFFQHFAPAPDELHGVLAP